MNSQFFENPILNSPYSCPNRHWELDSDGQPTQEIIERRRRAEFISFIPNPKKRGGKAEQQRLAFDEGKGLSTRKQQYAQHAEIINSVRREVDDWRRQPDPNRWRVTPETQRLLQHWRHHQFGDIRPFFCQVEAVETVIWLTEVAPQLKNTGRRFLQYLDDASQEANPGLLRLAIKLATGAGKTMVMAMLIAWQTINAVRRPQSNRFTRGFLIVTPGLTIKDRLRVLKPNDPDSYFRDRELVPGDLLPVLGRAKIVVTNYHALRRRERIEIAKGGRLLLQGRGLVLDTRESEGQMLQRVMPELMGMKNILVLNDEAHHCYRENPGARGEGDLKGDEKKEAEKNREAARLWISGIEAVNRKLGTSRVIDLSATPFFLSGSGYAEGTLFPWTMCDFSLMDAIECGIVKLPRVPVADNVPGNTRARAASGTEMPMYRELWKHIRTRMPKQGRGKAGALNPLSLPPQLRTALDALYGHYEQTFRLWEKAGISVPPCFIVVCNNTAASKLVYDYISGFYRQKEDGSRMLENGRLELFRNFNREGNPLGRPHTLLIDSEQLESGDALDSSFRKMAATEIERFRREIVERTGDRRQAENISDDELLREVMNTVGKPGRLGDSIRCVVSVSMLSEGWDANTVTHVLGVRAFGTQLLCEQVVGRALRRQSYELNGKDRFTVEYADVLGIPFDFTATPVVTQPTPPRETIHVHAVRPERDHLEIRFPRVAGYGVELPEDDLTAEFNEDSGLVLTPDLVGATETRNSGIIGESVDLNLAHTGAVRPSQVVYELTAYLLLSKFRDADGEPRLHLFGQLKRIVREWVSEPPRLQRRNQHLAVGVQDDCRHCLRARRGRNHPFPALAEQAGEGHPRPLQPDRLDRARQLPYLQDEPVPDRSAPLPCQLGHPGQRLGGGTLPRGRGPSPRESLREEPQPRLRSALHHGIGDAEVRSRLHRAGARPKLRPGLPAPGGRDQGLPGRRCEAQKGDHGDLLDTRRESTRYPWSLGVRGADRRLHSGRGLRRQGEERGPWTHRKGPAGSRDRGREKFGRGGRKHARP